MRFSIQCNPMLGSRASWTASAFPEQTKGQPQRRRAATKSRPAKPDHQKWRSSFTLRGLTELPMAWG